MASPAQLAANRLNAHKSTGPRTRAGKARVAQNARRHGLNTSLHLDATYSPRLPRVAALLAEGCACETAEHLAFAFVELRRVQDVKRAVVRQARAELMTRAPGLAGPELETRAFLDAQPQLIRLDRYEQAISVRLRRALADFDAERAAAG
jgi:hypothetical protein